MSVSSSFPPQVKLASPRTKTAACFPMRGNGFLVESVVVNVSNPRRGTLDGLFRFFQSPWQTPCAGFWGLADATWMFAAAWLIGGAVSGYTYQASIYFTLEEMAEKGKGSGFHEAVVGGGMFFGPLLVGWVGNNHTLRAPYFFCAAALALLIVAQILLVLFRRKTSGALA